MKISQVTLALVWDLGLQAERYPNLSITVSSNPLFLAKVKVDQFFNQPVTMSENSQRQDSIESQLSNVFKTKLSDQAYNVGEAVVSSLPYGINVPASYLYKTLLVAPATKRIQLLLEAVVKELESAKIQIDAINFENEVFQTTLLQACSIATRTHKAEKLDALRNAILNSFMLSSLEDDTQAMFLNWIDEFTASHLLALKSLHYLDQYSPEEFQAYFPELDKNRARYNQILKDLAARSLIDLREVYITEEDDKEDLLLPIFGATPELFPSTSRRRRGQQEVNMKTVKHSEDIDSLLKNSHLSPRNSKTTELGKQFIEYIENPFTSVEPL